MLRRLYESVLALAGHRRAGWFLALVSFAESSVFPIPPDAMLVPMCLARPERALRYALICTIASVLGGMLGYAIGYWLWDALADPIMRAYGYADAKLRFDAWYGDYGLWIILIKGLTPIPYKIVTIASGATKFPFLVFVAASVATRGARFFMLALLLRRFGEPIRDFIERRLTLVTSVAAAGVVGGFLLLKLL